MVTPAQWTFKPGPERWSIAEIVEHVIAVAGKSHRNDQATALASTPGLRDHAVDSPPLKAVSRGTNSVMDGDQWILAAAAHAERHTEVIADDSFPA